MERRRLLRVSVGGILVGVCGCIDTFGTGNDDGAGNNGEWSPEINGDEPELSPGAETTVHVETSGIRGLVIDGTQDEGRDMITLKNADATFSPPPDAGVDTDPAVHVWDSQSTVAIEIPVSVAEDADSGEYRYAITVLENNTREGESLTEEFTVTVSED